MQIAHNGSRSLAAQAARDHHAQPCAAHEGRTWYTESRHGQAVSRNEVRAHHFYNFHLDEGTGPIINPFPMDPPFRARRAHAHHHPREPFRGELGVSRDKIRDASLRLFDYLS